MHPNPIFRKTAQGQALAFARDRAFGLLAVSADPVPLMAHVPFLLAEDGTWADLHLVRSNPICRLARQGVPARLAVSGPDGYVSPDWYGIDDQVPTWNYLAVHLTGTLMPLPADQIEDLLVRQSAHFEAQLAKPAWTMDKMQDETKIRMMRMILPFRLRVTEVDSTFKVNQNKSQAARETAADAVMQGHGHELAALASWMRSPPGEDTD